MLEPDVENMLDTIRILLPCCQLVPQQCYAAAEEL